MLAIPSYRIFYDNYQLIDVEFGRNGGGQARVGWAAPRQTHCTLRIIFRPTLHNVHNGPRLVLLSQCHGDISPAGFPEHSCRLMLRVPNNDAVLPDARLFRAAFPASPLVLPWRATTRCPRVGRSSS